MILDWPMKCWRKSSSTRRLQLLGDVVPGLARVAALLHIEAAARTLGLRLQLVPADGPDDCTPPANSRGKSPVTCRSNTSGNQTCLCRILHDVCRRVFPVRMGNKCLALSNKSCTGGEATKSGIANERASAGLRQRPSVHSATAMVGVTLATLPVA